jgi:hypothetical protein
MKILRVFRACVRPRKENGFEHFVTETRNPTVKG